MSWTDEVQVQTNLGPRTVSELLEGEEIVRREELEPIDNKFPGLQEQIDAIRGDMQRQIDQLRTDVKG